MHSYIFCDEDLVGLSVGILVIFETVKLNLMLELGEKVVSHGCPVGLDGGRLGGCELG
jgi:hypothetical protein